MPEPHLMQHLAAFVMGIWWTKQWLITRPVSRWRFGISALAGAILWVYVAYTATSVVEASSGVVVEYQSMALAYFSGFMAFVSVIGVILGLLLWTEEETQAVSDGLPSYVKSQISDD